MSLARLAVPLVAVACLICVLAPASAAPARELANLSVIVRDTAGRLLSGSVLLLNPDGNPDQMRTASTREDGRYLFADLSPGTYQVTAVKSGYAVAVERINTAMRSSLDIVLRPGSPADPDLRNSLDWVLRLPPRDILREIGPGELPAGDPPAGAGGDMAAGPGGSSGAAGPVLSAPVDGELEQWFSGALRAEDGGGQAEQGLGSLTALRFGMRLGESVDVSLSGKRDRRESLPTGRSGEYAGGDRFGLAMACGLGGASRMDMRASYGRDDLALDPGGFAPAEAESVTRSVATSWTTSVGGGTLDLAALYVDAVARGGAWEREWAGSVSNRLWRAGGAFKTTIGDGHDLTFVLGTRMLQAEALDEGVSPLVGPVSPLVLAGPAPEGWALHVRGTEDWRLTDRWSLNLALDHFQSLANGDYSHTLPRAGLTWLAGPGREIRGTMSYLAESDLDLARSSAAVLPERTRERRRVGYEVSYEQGGEPGSPSGSRVSVSSTPVDDRGTGMAPAFGLLATDSIYVTDGAAQSEEVRLELRRGSPSFGAELSSSVGRIGGRYAVFLPGVPIEEMHEGDLRFFAAAITARAPRIGTEARMEVRRFEEDRAPVASAQAEIRAAAASGLAAEQLQLTGFSLRISQDLRFLQIGSSRWRVMLSYQSNRGIEEALGDPEAPSGEEARLPMVASRLSGGVAVQF